MAKPTVRVESASGTQDSAIPLKIEVASPDPKDTLALEIGPLLPGAVLTAGTPNGVGVWSLDLKDLPDLRYVPPFGRTGATALHVKASATDASSQVQSADETLEVAVTTSSDEDLRKKMKEQLVIATPWQKCLLGVLLVIASALIVLAWFWFFSQVQNLASREYSVKWRKPVGTILRSEEPTFWYDHGSGTLLHRGAIDKERKRQLYRSLETGNSEKQTVTSGAPADQSKRDATRTAKGDESKLAEYQAAVDELSYRSQAGVDEYFLMLLILAGLSGVVGIQTRAVINFVRIACVSNVLDVQRWWPWYLLRPPLGFMLGLLAVLIIEAKIFVPGENASPGGTSWWLAIAFLVGFGADDFSERLRNLSQTLFGRGSK